MFWRSLFFLFLHLIVFLSRKTADEIWFVISCSTGCPHLRCLFDCLCLVSLFLCPLLSSLVSVSLYISMKWADWTAVSDVESETGWGWARLSQEVNESSDLHLCLKRDRTGRNVEFVGKRKFSRWDSNYCLHEQSFSSYYCCLPRHASL